MTRWLLIIVLLASNVPRPCCGCGVAPIAPGGVAADVSGRGRHGCPYCDPGTGTDPADGPRPCRCHVQQSADLWLESADGTVLPELAVVDLAGLHADAAAVQPPGPRRAATPPHRPRSPLRVLLERFLL
jgi:hypothetical protein